MRVIRDVKCPEGHVEFDTLSDPEGVYNCTTCGKPTTTYFATLADGVRERKADAFVPVVFGGVRYETHSDWNECRKSWKREHFEDLNVVGDSARGRRSMLEEANQSALNHARSRGNDRSARDIERAGSRHR